jgi:hypothetical protein
MVRRSGLWTKKPTSDEAQDNEGTFQIVQSRRAYVENSGDRSPNHNSLKQMWGHDGSSAEVYLNDALCPVIEHAPLTVDTFDSDQCVATPLLRLQSRADCEPEGVEPAFEF